MAGLSAFARKAAVRSAFCSGMVLGKLENRKSGAPIPEKGVFWSISHKLEMVAGVAASKNIGIDIEKIKPVSDELFKRVVTCDEKKLFGREDKELVFFRTFTAKEAVLKRNGQGIGKLSQVRVVSVRHASDLQVEFLNQKYWVENFINGGYLASVTKNGQQVQWITG